MEIYYKYAKFRSIEELLSATVKLSPPQTLNDPFESILNQEVEDNLLKTLSLADVDIEVDNDNDIDEGLRKNVILKRVYDGLNDYAVFSLSETPRNLLMWAHYADEHKGVCIGYKKDIFESIDNKPETDLGIESYTPIKVNYDNLRPQVLSNQPSREERKKITFNQLITKSDDWMYEKEHRCIIPMNWADKVKIKDTGKTIAGFSLPYLLTNLISSKKIEQKGDIYTGGIGTRGMSILVHLLGNDRNAIFLKHINPKSIVSIYFGCRFDQGIKKEILSTLSDPSHPLHHVKTCQYVLSSNRFEIVPQTNKDNPRP
ncbi:DUF2971 domain-containing protein [Aeromonas caviae]|uniref:DUF2971 domain-containing protein n=1 Tax=Aeromonas caviae TaxID=648 RepID=UPI002B49B7DE|nr:DUF2971 domain-containing protein [Aeromonas caviae]